MRLGEFSRLLNKYDEDLEVKFKLVNESDPIPIKLSVICRVPGKDYTTLVLEPGEQT